MAPVLIPVVSAITSALSYTSLVGVIGIGGISMLSHAVVNLAASFLIGKLFKPKAPQISIATDQGLRQTIRGSAEARRIIYGQVKVGGVLVHVSTTGSKNEYAHMVVAFAGHEVEEIGDIYLGDTLSTDARFTGLVTINKHLGSSDQNADSTLVSEVTDWTTSHRLRGIAYIYLKLKWDQDVFFTGLPQITAVIKGAKVYDPRSSTTAYSNNWALCIRDYLTSSYGLEIPDADINDTSIIAAANIADEDVNLEVGTQKRYTADGISDLELKPADILERLLTAGAGALVFAQGKYTLYAGAYTTPTVTLDESDLRGTISLQVATPRQEIFNAVRGIYYDSVEWLPKDFPPMTNATYEAEDGGDRIYRDIELPYTTNDIRAQRIAKIFLEKSRQDITVNFPAKLSALQLITMDTVNVSIERLGWTNKVFRVVSWSLSNEGGVDLILQEEASTNYDWAYGDATEYDAAPNTNLPDPYNIPAPTGLTLASGTDYLLALSEGSIISRIYVTWDSTDGWDDSYQIQFKKSIDSTWTTANNSTPDSFIYIGPVEDGINYDVRIRVISTLGTRSPWTSVTNHLVIGKTEAPAEPSDFTISRLADGTRRFSWLLVTDADVRSGGGYRIRYYLGSTSDWSAMTPIHDGLLSSSPWETNELAAGTYTFAIKAIDSSDNESDPVFISSVTLDNPRLQNVLVQRLEHALGWPGTLTDCWDFNGTLISISSSTINDLPDLISSLAEEIDIIGTNNSPIIYDSPEIDLGSDLDFTPLVAVVLQGTATIQMKTGTSSDGGVVGSWVPVAHAEGKRYLQIRVQSADTAPQIHQVTILVDSESQTDYYEDVNTATESASWFSRTAAGHFKIATKSQQIATITVARIGALQNVGSGYSWELISKSVTVGGEPAAEFKIYDSDGVLADAVIDAELFGSKG
ncbi:MAG: phage tail protein [Candidatus Thiodiazotropha lotti]|nr:phage tail protein [Candidatus Thiodiazotropha lotti]